MKKILDAQFCRQIATTENFAFEAAQMRTDTTGKMETSADLSRPRTKDGAGGRFSASAGNRGMKEAVDWKRRINL